ncbi:hypothetical protein MC7420_1687 [Coleofasciculus chthonoplastes PCC 7420]|uniref:Uncharacterized protein n=1 Tax=Coleofasciculus chthonoplastes PCC 7420 TaxID=118168 RepID=B4VM64_9CYAN|nr:hypothetical protein MC7420_1687 [Coleofasciculus chthonoplastes PCC 7420]
MGRDTIQSCPDLDLTDKRAIAPFVVEALALNKLRRRELTELDPLT